MDVENIYINWDLRKNETMLQAIRQARLPICITDPSLPDNPIVFANLAFSTLTGYEPDEIIGKNCRFLQGEETSPESIAAVRSVIDSQAVDTVEILNYRRDGSTFLNALQIGPIFDDNGKLVFFFGSQLDISAKREAELEARALADEELLHRLSNIVNVLTVIIRMTAREEKEVDVLSQKVIGRLQALSLAHFDTIIRPKDANPGIRELAASILAAYAPLGEQQFRLSGPAHSLPKTLISPVTLVLHELATNAVKHGALGCDTGSVEIKWGLRPHESGEAIEIVWAEKNGPKVIVPVKRSGSKIIEAIVASAGGVFEVNWCQNGLNAKAVFIL